MAKRGWTTDQSRDDPRKLEVYFPGITNPEFQELRLSWAKKQIDCGADGVWIDGGLSGRRSVPDIIANLWQSGGEVMRRDIAEAARCTMKNPAALRRLLAVALALPVMMHAADQSAKAEQPWCEVFSVDKAELADTGKNRHFFLWPGYRLFLQHGKDTLVISVLEETKLVDGVKTRVVEERETQDGKLVEVSRNYFAISRRTGDVYYFGEAVDTYKNGKISGHEGSWLAGVNGAKFGLMMPGRPGVGDKYYQEIAPGVAMDRAEINSRSEDFTTPHATFERCLRVRESSGLEKGSEDKLYAPDVGLIKDGELVLVAVECPLCEGKQNVPTIPPE